MGWSRLSPRRCGGLCPHLKKSFAGALLRRWGLHFSGGSPESIRAGRTSPGQSQELPRPLRALACWRVRCGEGMPPLSAQPEGSPSKRKYEASKREIDCGVRGGGEKLGATGPHFPAIEAAYLIGCTSKGGARYRNRPQDAKTGRNRIAPKRPLKRDLKRCKLSGSKRPALWVGMPQNAIQAATS
jgi:hypothetical protein